MFESISHGISKWKRNWAAREGKTDFERHVIKATFEGDEKEPKAKHVIYLMDCFKNRVVEIKRKEAFSQLFKKFLDNLGNWVHTMKVYTIFHVALQDQTTLKEIASELKDRESLLYCYAKPPDEREYIEIRHFELSQIYSNYIKKLVTFITGCRILDQTQVKQKEYIKNTSTDDVVWIYNQLRELIDTIINKFYANTLFCCKYRIYRNILKLLYVDLVRFYRICYICVTESMNNLESLDLSQIKKIDEMCKSFMKLTEETQKQVGGMASQLKDPLPATITYFKATPSLLKNLKDFIAAKEEVAKIQEEEKEMAPVGYNLPAGEEEEFNLDENKEEEEFNLEGGGLEEFMTSVKKPAPRFEETKAVHYATNAIPKVPAARPKKATEEDNEILGFAQGGKGGVDEFDKLFGDEISASGPPPRPVVDYSAPKQPQASAYDQFASYYNTYQQPAARPAPMPNPYAQQRPTKISTPFDEVESKYSGLNQNPGNANDFW